MDVQWIDNASDLEAFLNDADDLLAVDTESDHFHAYDARVCLIQVATRDACALVDPLALEEVDLAPFLKMLEDPGVEKVFHAGRNDIGELDRDYGARVRGFFDTQIACRFLNTDGSGLSWLLEEFFDVKSSKKYQRYDWTTRPIPGEPRHYAATDVLHLLAARDRLIDQLEEAGWLEAFRQQCRYVAESTHYSPNEFDPEGWRRLKSKKKLNEPTRAVLSALFSWRHEYCREVNRAALHVLKNGALMRLATKRPTTREELDQIGGISKQLVHDRGDELLQVIAAAKDAEAPPARLERQRSERPPQDEIERFKRYKSWRNKKAKEIGIPTEFIATNDTLSSLAADPPKSVEDLEKVREILPWQVERFGKKLVRLS